MLEVLRMRSDSDEVSGRQAAMVWSPGRGDCVKESWFLTRLRYSKWRLCEATYYKAWKLY